MFFLKKTMFFFMFGRKCRISEFGSNILLWNRRHFEEKNGQVPVKLQKAHSCSTGGFASGFLRKTLKSKQK